MAEAEHIARRAERVTAGAGVAREPALVGRLLAREHAPPERKVPGDTIELALPRLRTLPTVTPGRPAPLLARVARRKIVLQPAGPRRGGAR